MCKEHGVEKSLSWETIWPLFETCRLLDKKIRPHTWFFPLIHQKDHDYTGKDLTRTQNDIMINNNSNNNDNNNNHNNNNIMIILGNTLQKPIMTGDSTEDQILEAGRRYMNRQLFSFSFAFCLVRQDYANEMEGDFSHWERQREGNMLKKRWEWFEGNRDMRENLSNDKRWE